MHTPMQIIMDRVKRKSKEAGPRVVASAGSPSSLRIPVRDFLSWSGGAFDSWKSSCENIFGNFEHQCELHSEKSYLPSPLRLRSNYLEIRFHSPAWNHR
jgi:hypothetical protein